MKNVMENSIRIRPMKFGKPLARGFRGELPKAMSRTPSIRDVNRKITLVLGEIIY